MSEELIFEIHPLEVDRWDDLVELFGKTGGDGGCWCMYWRLSQKEYNAGDRNRNKRLLNARALSRNYDLPNGFTGS